MLVVSGVEFSTGLLPLLCTSLCYTVIKMTIVFYDEKQSH